MSPFEYCCHSDKYREEYVRVAVSLSKGQVHLRALLSCGSYVQFIINYFLPLISAASVDSSRCRGATPLNRGRSRGLCRKAAGRGPLIEVFGHNAGNFRVLFHLHSSLVTTQDHLLKPCSPIRLLICAERLENFCIG